MLATFLYLSSLLLFIPDTVGSFVGGFIYEYSPALSWLIQAEAFALSMVLVFALVREPERREA
jgi:hypothetical protein